MGEPEPELGTDQDENESTKPMFYVRDKDHLYIATEKFPISDGSIILGRDDAIVPKYATRFRISEREKQRGHVTREIVEEMLLPCINKEYTSSPLKLIWGILKSEMLLMNLHLIMIVLGLMKIFIHTKELEEELHLSHTIMEVVLACFIITIRSAASKEMFHKIKATRLEVEYIQEKSASRSFHIKCWVYSYILIAFTMCATNIVSLVLLYFLHHLGWTLLVCNGTVVISYVSFKITEARLCDMISHIKLDQHKVVLYECILLIQEFLSSDNPVEKRQVEENIKKFCVALKHSKAFALPEYISCPDESKGYLLESIETRV